MKISRIAILLIFLAHAIVPQDAAFAQDPAAAQDGAPAAAAEEPSSPLVDLGGHIYEQIVPILEARLTNEDEGPCPLVRDMPQCFDTEAARRNAMKPVVASAARNTRVTALKIIEGYALLVEAVGRGEVEPARGEAGRLRRILEDVIGNGAAIAFAKGVIETAVPVPDAVTDAGFAVIVGLLTRIMESGDVETQSEALVAGAVVVERMIAGLIAEAPRIYDIYYLAHNDEVIRLEGEERKAELQNTGNIEAIKDELETRKAEVRDFHARLAEFVVRLDRRRAVMAILLEASGTPGEGLAGGGPARTPDTAASQVRRSAGLLKFLKQLVRADFN